MAQTGTTASPSFLLHVFPCLCVCTSFWGAWAERQQSGLGLDLDADLNLNLNVDRSLTEEKTKARASSKALDLDTDLKLDLDVDRSQTKEREKQTSANSKAKPTFSGRDSAHAKILQELWEQSVDWAQNAAGQCLKADELLLAWFGNNDKTTKQHVCDHMLKIVDALDNLHLQDDECSFSGGDSTMMCVKDPRRDANNRYIIHVCPPFYKSLDLGSKHSSKYGVLVHEASHHFGTTDEKLQGKPAYGAARSFQLARTSTKQALNNADNYKWFAYYIRRNGAGAGPKQLQKQEQGPCAGQTAVYGSILSVSAQCHASEASATSAAPTEVTAVFFDKAAKVLQSPEIRDDPQKESFVVDTFNAPKKQDLAKIVQIELWYEVAGSYYSGSTAWGKGNGVIKTQRIDLKPTPPDVLPCQLEFHTKVKSQMYTKTTSILKFPTDMSLECSVPVRPVKFSASGQLDTIVKVDGNSGKPVTQPVPNMVLKAGDYFRDFDQKTYTFVGEVDERRLQLSQKVPNALEEPCELSLQLVEGKVYLVQAVVYCTVEVKDVTVKLENCGNKGENLPTQITKRQPVSVAQIDKNRHPNCMVVLYGYVNGVFGYKKSGKAR